MGGKVDLFNLGSLGVDLTKSKVHADDGSLRSAQNAIPDYRGEAGGLSKRDGLVAINSTTVGGSVQGAILSPLGAGTSTITLYVGLGANGWRTSTDGFSNSASVASTQGLPISAVTLFNSIVPTARNVPTGSATLNNRIYFATNNYTQDTDAPALHVLDGVTFRELCRIPTNPDVGAVSKAILAVFAQNGNLYVSTWDAGTSSADLKGSVYSVDPTTGVLTKLGATFPTGYLPWCMEWFMGRLWVGTYSDDATFSGRVYWIRPNIDSSWTLDHTTTAGQGEILSLKTYKGNLYAGTAANTGSSALVKKRTTLGVWSTSDTGAGTTVYNAYNSLAVFNGNLYALYDTAAGSGNLIRKFDNSTWATTHSFDVLGSIPHTLFAYGGFIVASSKAGSQLIYSSSDGITFTLVASGTLNSGACYGALAI